MKIGEILDQYSNQRQMLTNPEKLPNSTESFHSCSKDVKKVSSLYKFYPMDSILDNFTDAYQYAKIRMSYN